MNKERLIQYDEGMAFSPQCVTCGRYVKPDKSIKIDAMGQPRGRNCTCKKCGRSKMLFRGYA